MSARQLELPRGRRVAVSNASFELPAGAVSALIGPNGSGKSTLLHAIAGVLAPSSGHLRVLGGTPAGERARVSYVLQSSQAGEHLPVTVREVVTMGCYAKRGLLGRLSAEDRGGVDDALETMEIAALARRNIDELSAGQRQRVFVAQGLAPRAELLLLDEPVTGLDLVSRRRILDRVAAERDAGRTVVMATHELAEAMDADHVVLLAGRVVAEGPPAAALDIDHLSEAYRGRLVEVEEGRILLDDPHHRGGDNGPGGQT